MNVEERQISTIVAAPDNPNVHSEASIAAIAASLQKYGWRQAIVVKGDVVVAGHGRLEAARRLGWLTAPCVSADDLTDAEAREYRLADNQTARLSEWDEGRLAGELAALPGVDWTTMGFNGAELEQLAALAPTVETPPQDAPYGGQEPSEDDDEGEPADNLRPAPDGALTPPFTWFGSKRRAAGEIIARLGTTDTYIEPFAGSLAVLLAKPPARRELVGDTDGGIANFWRAIRADPDGVAKWADNPSVHHDLAARHRWLIQWKRENADRLMEDPDYYDARAAGHWCWGLALWIGGGWAADAAQDWEQRPAHKGLSAVAADRAEDSRPFVGGPVLSGRGVSAQTGPSERRPFVAGESLAGKGVSPQVGSLPADGSWDGLRLQPWLRALSARLAKVTTINRPWQSLVTPTMMGQTAGAKGRGNTCAVFLDPPYKQAKRSKNVLYESDTEAGASDTAAQQSFEWAVQNGDRVRIAYCCHGGDFELPAGWTQVVTTFHGVRKASRRRTARDVVFFSPACEAC